MSDRGSKRILVIDDEPSITIYLCAVLEDHGYRVESATDGAEGLALAREAPPDLICLDIMMPKRSGVALYRDVRADERLRGVPVVFVSAYTQAHNTLSPDHPRFFQELIGDDDTPPPQAFVEKPIEVESFVRTIEGALDMAPA